MTKILLLLSLIFSASALAHGSHASGVIHQAEHFFWALAVILLSWALMPGVEGIRQVVGKRLENVDSG